jgi:hypothetical protein
MKYLIVSEREVLDKTAGEYLEEKELLEAGVNIQALIDGNHITAPNTKPVIPEGDKK